ncbi:GNAT family N-acetyltransferase [Agromyces sp. Marseille-P2726]|uniref:GNAT family N-acetyltransferase n=1 Tax=Agromyces sp. Marseille-P2726 TaxID=2709132 RepID=UPI00156FDDD1|nr:GNAT family N-acetyltransferase [Agromyces sp. Marseille-P2726]
MNTSPVTALELGVEPVASADDAELVAAIADLVNLVYDDAEAGLWFAGARRTGPQEIAELIRRRELVTARSGGRVVGTVRVQQLDDRLAEFGMLTADPQLRGVGIGRELVAFAERRARELGCTEMQLELLVPNTWSHPSKVFLRDWYARIGYRHVRTTRLDELYPELAPLLATACDLVISRKDLEEFDR